MPQRPVLSLNPNRFDTHWFDGIAFSRWQFQWAKNPADLTGWDLKSIEKKMALYADSAALALCWNEQGQDEKALSDHKKALELDSGNATTWSNRGLSLVQLKHLQEALEAFKKALSINSTDWTARSYQKELRIESGLEKQ